MVGDSLLVCIIVPEISDTYNLLYSEHEQKYNDSFITAGYCAINNLGSELFNIQVGSARQRLLKLTSSLC